MPAADSLVAVNGREYRRPTRPTVVMTIDGCQPAYLDDGIARGLMPRLAALLAGEGAYHLGRGVMPSLTNPNNVSIVTGAAPADSPRRTSGSWTGRKGSPSGSSISLDRTTVPRC